MKFNQKFNIKLEHDYPGRKDTEVRSAYGRITIGDFYEYFYMSSNWWTIEDYEKQWKLALERISNKITTCFITNVQTTPLVEMWAFYREGKTIYIQYLYNKKIPFLYKDSSSATVLHVACGASGDFEVVKFLYENKIFTDVNDQTDEGETPFLLAVMYEHEDIVKFFLECANPDLSLSTKTGETALSLAVKNNNPERVSPMEEYVQL